MHKVKAKKALHVFIDVSMFTQKAEDDSMQRMKSLIEIVSSFLYTVTVTNINIQWCYTYYPCKQGRPRHDGPI